VAEHLKLSSDCGWAIVKHAGQQAKDVSTMEDPTDDRLFEARKATFGSRWSHENKRGWVCKTEKMAAAGWHFAPTAECEDLVSCAYCNLSLDGWEPKDSPL
jgi:Inhibitor of Apoptosis domain